VDTDGESHWDTATGGVGIPDNGAARIGGFGIYIVTMPNIDPRVGLPGVCTRAGLVGAVLGVAPATRSRRCIVDPEARDPHDVYVRGEGK